MWQNAQAMLVELEKVLSIEEAYVMGSFTTKKSRPADVDFVILLKVKEENPEATWSVDLVIAPNNAYGRLVQKDAEQWTKKKYRLKNYAMTRLK
jgi:hypothetical protein